MKDLHGSASARVAAAPERCFDLLVAVDGYPQWYPDVVRSASVAQRDGAGAPVRAHATLHAAFGPLVRDFRVEWAVVSDRPSLVRLSRVPHGGGDQERLEVTWRITPGPPTTIAVELNAQLSVPRLLPVGGLGDTVASGFLNAATRALSG